MKKNLPIIDLTKPRSQRPMTGLDIEQWRAERGMDKYGAQYALGFRNSNHYNKMCLEPILPPALELLIRLYEASPLIPGPGWAKYSLPQLFDLMYGDVMKQFEGTSHQVYAKVDLGTRFTKIFGRSSARQYQWIGDDPKRNDPEINAYSVMDCILCKLHEVTDPKPLLEQVARKLWLLRGVDLDSEFRVPSAEHPPTREKTGRKSKMALGTRKPPVRPRAVAAKPTAVKSAVPQKAKAPAAKKTPAAKQKTPLKALKAAEKSRAKKNTKN